MNESNQVAVDLGKRVFLIHWCRLGRHNVRHHDCGLINSAFYPSRAAGGP